MNLPYIDTIYLGIVRMLLWILFLYIIKRLIFPAKASQNQVKTMGFLWSFYGSIVLLVIFILVQLNSFDLLSCLALMAIFLGLSSLGFKRKTFSLAGWRRKRLSILVGVLENVEDKNPIITLRRHNRDTRFGVKTEFIVATFAALTAIAVRFFLLQFDNYQLSIAWFNELNGLIDIREQRWISSDLLLSGHYGFMSFYQMLTGISPEMALESFGLFQVFLLAFILFWFIDNMTNSLITIPLLGTLVFALFFNLAPINIFEITHAKPSYMAMTFFLPAVVYIIRPWKLYRRKPGMYFISMLVLFAAIALIDLFTSFILVPTFFAVYLPFLRKRYVRYYLDALYAYLIGTAVIMSYYYVASLVQGFDFILFLNTNLIAITTTTTTGNMVLPYDSIVLIFQIVTLVSVSVMLFFFRKKKNKWTGAITFLIYVNVLVLISKTGFDYFDVDLLNEISPILLSGCLGMVFYLIYYVFNVSIKRIEISDWYAPPLIFATLCGIAYYSQKEFLIRADKTNTTSKEVLEAYELIKSQYLPQGYAVVNDNNMLAMSQNSHLFISYRDFLETYSERDSVYFQYRDNPAFLEANTEYILPNSVLVFLYEGLTDEFNSKIGIEKDVIDKVDQQLSTLQSKGRALRLVYEKSGLRIMEIVNKPNAAKLSELF